MSIDKSTKARNARAHETSDELEFIAKLGTHTDHGQAMGRMRLLWLYRDALAKRHDWGVMDKSTVIRAAADAR